MVMETVPSHAQSFVFRGRSSAVQHGRGRERTQGHYSAIVPAWLHMQNIKFP
ncbi:hypothetical protein HMPREF0731_2207 [Pseudoroseomonas cervicalis ATCC 49957]|uniref:Uncharacterized protein n=1 Tax=Pseudoroseomonas cervicalis ATCC 49957 TaxID=525371 RepID=D5RM96_9PROT|nr:hypothetical protein HMPREF0731_2207 [Pseudoroseomonas cervicalis ATCC 49957]